MVPHICCFQERRADREVERLFWILEYTTELKESQLDRTERLGDCHLPSLEANVNVALSMCNRVLQREENFDRVSAPIFLSFISRGTRESGFIWCSSLCRITFRARADYSEKGSGRNS